MDGRTAGRSGPRRGVGSRRTCRSEPLPSGDTREGFARHLEWERRLFDARWAVVSWPEAYGGRDASLWEWLIFEEEYYRAGAPQRVTQNGIFLLAPTLFEFGTPDAAGPVPPDDGERRGDLVPGLVRARRGQRPRRHPVDGDVRDDAAGGWRLSGQKTWTTRGARSARTSSACSAPTRRRNGTTGSPTSSSRSTRPA